MRQAPTGVHPSPAKRGEGVGEADGWGQRSSSLPPPGPGPDLGLAQGRTRGDHHPPTLPLRGFPPHVGGGIGEASRISVGALRRRMAARLRAAWGEDDPDRTPDLDARLLVAHLLGVDAATLILRDDDEAPPALVAGAKTIVERRIAGEPVARIVGEKGFWSLSFRLSPETLVPRPDTETVVAAALATLAAAGRTDAPLSILDLGTGSGCILLATLAELPRAFGVGVDRDEGAVRTARGNAVRLGLGDRCAFLAGDWLAALSGRFDAILANPPYIRSSALPFLPVEVRRFDPALALAGGEDGLDAYRAIIPNLRRFLSPGGFAVMEFGPDQAVSLAALAAAAGLRTTIRQDLDGRDRAAIFTIG